MAVAYQLPSFGQKSTTSTITTQASSANAAHSDALTSGYQDTSGRAP